MTRKQLFNAMYAYAKAYDRHYHWPDKLQGQDLEAHEESLRKAIAENKELAQDLLKNFTYTDANLLASRFDLPLGLD